MKIHAAFNAAFGESVSIYAAVVDETLVIAKLSGFNTKQDDGMVLITNNRLINADFYLENSDFQAAYQAFQSLVSLGKCVIQQDLARYKLDNVIDYIGQKDNGEENFNIAALSNGNWAILGICLYFYRHVYTSQKFDMAMDVFHEMENFFVSI